VSAHNKVSDGDVLSTLQSLAHAFVNLGFANC